MHTKQVIFKHVSIDKLKVGDIVILECQNGSLLDFPYQNMLVEKIENRRVYFVRPYAHLFISGIAVEAEKFTALSNMTHLKYTVWRVIAKDNILKIKYNNLIATVKNFDFNSDRILLSVGAVTEYYNPEDLEPV